MTNTNPRDLIQSLSDALYNAIRVIEREDGTQHIDTARPVLAEARAYLALPEPEVPTEEEILELSGEHFDYRGDSMGGWFIPISIGPTIELSNQVHAFARAVLARWGK
jgi:hypothetical protein